MIKLRPHHLFCIHYFIGYGYSEEFTKNMKEIIKRLEQEEIKIVFEMDDLCKCCPNNLHGICKSQEKVESFDKNASFALALEENKTYNYQELKQKVIDYLEKNKREKVCGNCEWSHLCHK